MGNVIKKLVIGLVVGGALVGITRALEFPVVFQMMFFAYAMLGAAVFMLLDAPSLKTMSGSEVLIALVVFYIVLCTVFIAGASMWPQYDPEDEKGKIDKILKPKRAATEQGKAEELIARAKALDEQVESLRGAAQGTGRRSAGGKQMPAAGAPPATTGANRRLYEAG